MPQRAPPLQGRLGDLRLMPKLESAPEPKEGSHLNQAELPPFSPDDAILLFGFETRPEIEEIKAYIYFDGTF
jgi:hypothetical protein